MEIALIIGYAFMAAFTVALLLYFANGQMDGGVLFFGAILWPITLTIAFFLVIVGLFMIALTKMFG